MRTLALLAQKGGVGKSTLAIHLAVLAAKAGGNVLLIDLDPQHSAGDWWRAREATSPALVETEAAELANVLKAAKAEGVTLAVIDTAPHSEAAAVTAARLADLVLIPTRPGILDLRAIGATVGIVQGVKAKAAIVLNSCPPSRGLGVAEAGIVGEARQGLEDYGLPVAPVAITQRAALSHALIDGRAVVEYEPDGKASRELGKLWQWIEKEF